LTVAAIALAAAMNGRAQRVLACAACLLATACAQAPEQPAWDRPAFTVVSPEVLNATRQPGVPALLKPLRVEYPLEARRLGQEGRVQVRMRVLADGSVGQVEIQKSSGVASLDLAAMRAAASATFSPPTKPDGTPAQAVVLMPMVFKLEP
jgi:TonB family protein